MRHLDAGNGLNKVTCPLFLSLILLVTAGSTAVSAIAHQHSSSSPVAQFTALSVSAAAEVQQQEVQPPHVKIKHVLKHSYHVFSVAFSPDGKQVAAGGILDRTVSIWDVNTGKLVRTLTEQQGGVNALAYSPDGRYLAAGRGFLGPAKDKISINLWDANTGKLVHNVPGLFPEARDASNDIKSMAFSPNSQTLVLATMDLKKPFFYTMLTVESL